MAQKAFVTVQRMFPNNNVGIARFRAIVDYAGDGILEGDPISGPYNVDTPDVTLTASSVQLKNQIIDAVIEHAASVGFNVGNGDVILGSLEIV